MSDLISFYNKIHIASPAQVADYLISRGKDWKRGTSATNNASKLLNQLDLDHQRGFYRLKSCRSNFDEHAKYLTDALIKILIQYPDSLIFREHLIEAVKLRPDALVLTRHNGFGYCFVLELLINEPPAYLTQKINTWNGWEGATEYLTNLFGFRIPHFDILTVEKGEDPCAKLPVLSSS